MSAKETGGPAFPHAPARSTPVGKDLVCVTPGEEPGMTLRDYFAAQAMAAMIGNASKDIACRSKEALDSLPAHAYMWADEMLEARK